MRYACNYFFLKLALAVEMQHNYVLFDDDSIIFECSVFHLTEK